MTDQILWFHFHQPTPLIHSGEYPVGGVGNRRDQNEQIEGDTFYAKNLLKMKPNKWMEMPTCRFT